MSAAPTSPDTEPTTMADALDPASVAGKLTAPQKRALLRQPCRSWWPDSYGPAAMCQHDMTGFALKRLGLCVGSALDAWPLTKAGVAVRAHLLAQQEQTNAH